MRCSIDCHDPPSGVVTSPDTGNTYACKDNLCYLSWFEESCRKTCGLCSPIGK